MKYIAKAVLTLSAAAVLLSGCGSELSDELPSVLPSVGDIPGRSAEVNVRDADAPSENIYSSGETEGQVTVTDETVSEMVSVSEEPADNTPVYDEEFFADDLFIGDSISTGYSGYGILDEKNVFAKVGLNPLTALETEVTTPDGDLLMSDAVASLKPKRAYIMLGSNGIEWLPCSNMLDAVSDIADAVHDASPETQVILLTIPPVTKDFDENNTELDVMEKIRDYNSRLAALCDDKELTCIDITETLEDNEGYFIHWYAETDGIHFKPTAYKMILSKIESTLEQ